MKGAASRSRGRSLGQSPHVMYAARINVSRSYPIYMHVCDQDGDDDDDHIKLSHFKCSNVY